MAGNTLKVRGVVSCSGLWGSLSAGEERDLPVDLAESLMRAGHAEPADELEAEKKDEMPEGAAQPKRRSKRANAS